MIQYVAIALVAFVMMELVSYLVHRFVYHKILWVIHKSHHTPRTGLFELNDLFPVVFASLTILLIGYAVSLPNGMDLLALGVGITMYGAVYLMIHDLYVHRRMKSLSFRIPLLLKIKKAHMVHHTYGEEPYGLLLFSLRELPGEQAAKERNE